MFSPKVIYEAIISPLFRWPKLVCHYSKSGALNGIESVQTNSPIEARYAKEVAKNEKPYFNLKAANHQIIGTSQMYSSTAARDNGIKSVMENGKTTTIKDLT
ncbi:YegP family protein [Shewanella baltica]|uniref:YegP family protein n=1 Tax=Shewanella baltica TaxID=62322 RepID=UPI00217DB3D8|nr:YegP family protein [Shewanella baltica]